MLRVVTILAVGLLSLSSSADSLVSSSAKVPIYDRGASTYYVPARVNGREETEFMVDTGSGYTTINEEMLSAIQQGGDPAYVKSISGVLADGSEISMPIYRISSLNIGGQCVIQDVEVAVLPGRTRNILGLSALKLVAPFSMYVDPPAIQLSNCKMDHDGTLELAASIW